MEALAGEFVFEVLAAAENSDGFPAWLPAEFVADCAVVALCPNSEGACEVGFCGPKFAKRLVCGVVPSAWLGWLAVCEPKSPVPGGLLPNRVEPEVADELCAVFELEAWPTEPKSDDVLESF